MAPESGFGSRWSLGHVMLVASPLRIYIVVAATGCIVTDGANVLIGLSTRMTVPFKWLESFWCESLVTTMLFITVSHIWTGFASRNDYGSEALGSHQFSWKSCVSCGFWVYTWCPQLSARWTGSATTRRFSLQINVLYNLLCKTRNYASWLCRSMTPMW